MGAKARKRLPRPGFTVSPPLRPADLAFIQTKWNQTRWCSRWVPTPNGKEILWDAPDSLAHYVRWIKYLVQGVLQPRGYRLNGSIQWVTSNQVIVVVDNDVTVETQV